MSENTQLAVPLYYEIYMQDLTHDYIDLTLLGIAKTHEEAKICCKLFKEALETASVRGLEDKEHRLRSVFFRPVLKGANNNNAS